MHMVLTYMGLLVPQDLHGNYSDVERHYFSRQHNYANVNFGNQSPRMNVSAEYFRPFVPNYSPETFHEWNPNYGFTPDLFVLYTWSTLRKAINLSGPIFSMIYCLSISAHQSFLSCALYSKERGRLEGHSKCLIARFR